MKYNKLILLILILPFICNLFAYYGQEGYEFSAWDVKSNGMGKTFLTSTEGYNALFYNPAKLARLNTNEIGIAGYFNVKNTEYYEYYDTDNHHKKIYYKPNTKISTIGAGFPIYQNHMFNLGFALGYQMEKDCYSKYKIDNYTRRSKGGYNSLCSGIGLSYKELISFGVTYKSSFYSYKKFSNMIYNETKNSLLMSAIIPYSPHTDVSVSYETDCFKTFHLNFDNYYIYEYYNPANLCVGLQYHNTQYKLSTQISLPLEPKKSIFQAKEFTLNTGLSSKINESNDILCGAYFNEKFIYYSFLDTYALTGGISHKISDHFKINTVLDYSIAKEKDCSNPKKNDYTHSVKLFTDITYSY